MKNKVLFSFAQHKDDCKITKKCNFYSFINQYIVNVIQWMKFKFLSHSSDGKLQTNSNQQLKSHVRELLEKYWNFLFHFQRHWIVSNFSFINQVVEMEISIRLDELLDSQRFAGSLSIISTATAAVLIWNYFSAFYGISGFVLIFCGVVSRIRDFLYQKKIFTNFTFSLLLWMSAFINVDFFFSLKIYEMWNINFICVESVDSARSRIFNFFIIFLELLLSCFHLKD